MEGIFYCEDVHSIGLLQEQIPVSQALSEEQVASPLASAYDMFLRPLLGDDIADHFRDLTKMIEEDEYNASHEEMHVLMLLRRATANLAFWYSFTELNIHITDQGFQRSESDTLKPVYRYQELELKQKFRNKGFNAVDELLRYMYSHLDHFPDYHKAPAYFEIHGNLVHGPEEIDKYYFVNSSFLVFLKLRPAFRRAMELSVEPTIGEKVCNDLRRYLSGAYSGNTEKEETCEELRRRVAAVVICKALSEHVRNIGEITDRGLYYTNIQANASENQNTNQASDSERARQAAHLNNMAMHYLHRLVRWVERELPEHFAGHPEDAYNRNNEHKYTFWA